MKHFLKKSAAGILAPITGSPEFFMAATLLGGIAPLAYQLTHYGHLFWFIIFTISQSTAATYLLCAALMLFNRRWLKAVLLIALTVYAMTECLLITGVDRPIDYEGVALLLDTNTSEAAGFIDEFFRWHTPALPLLLIAAVYAAAFGFGKLWHKVTRHSTTTAIAAGALVTVLLFGAIRFASNLTILGVTSTEKLIAWEFPDPDSPLSMSRRNQTRVADIYTKTFTIAKSIQLFFDDSRRWVDTQQTVRSTHHTDRHPADSLDIVFVLGESFIRNHSSLYGYRLETNPCLAAEMARGSLVRFDNAATTSGYTHEVMHNTLNLNSLSAHERWPDGAYWPLIFHMAGWKVYIYENQSARRDTDIGITAMLYNQAITDAYDGGSSRIFNYDGDFITHAADSLVTAHGGHRRLCFWHLLGQHYNASDRFPNIPANKKWTATDITTAHDWLNDQRREAVADYDNATLYNDRQVARIIDFYRHRNAIVIYASDHGEEMWDKMPSGARTAQHPESHVWIQQIYSIPMFVWMSDTYRERHPETVKNIRNTSARPVWLDNIGHAMLGLGTIDTPFYDPRLDWFSDTYTAPRRISSEGYDLDKTLVPYAGNR